MMFFFLLGLTAFLLSIFCIWYLKNKYNPARRRSTVKLLLSFASVGIVASLGVMVIAVGSLAYSVNSDQEKKLNDAAMVLLMIASCVCVVGIFMTLARKLKTVKKNQS